MNRKTIYIAGPMAGLPLYNFPAFFSAEERLARLGWKKRVPKPYTENEE